MIGHERGRGERVAAARAQGVDAAGSTAQGPVSDWGDGRYVYVWNENQLAIHWNELVPDAKQLAEVNAKVAALDRHGDVITVRFQDATTTYAEATGCYETGRIDRIDSDGQVHYREACTGSTTHSEHRKIEPMTFPAAELAGISAGDEIAAFSRLGGRPTRIAGRWIWFVKRGQRVARVRDVPM